MPNIAVPAPPESLFKLKFHQVAMYHAHPNRAVNFWKASGFNNWTHDRCLLRGIENNVAFEKTEEEWFNYDILPLELCYMRYSTGAPDAQYTDHPFFIHMAAYVDSLEDEMARIEGRLGLKPFTIYDSVTHENPYLTEKGITFHKCLYDTYEVLGFNVKLTQKVYHK